MRTKSARRLARREAGLTTLAAKRIEFKRKVFGDRNTRSRIKLNLVGLITLIEGTDDIVGVCTWQRMVPSASQR